MKTTDHMKTIPMRGSLVRVDEAPPAKIPAGHVGPIVLPGTGRMVYWTGRVAIGLRHQPVRSLEPMSVSATWIQRLMLRKPRRMSGAMAPAFAR